MNPILPPDQVHKIDQRLGQCDTIIDGLIAIYSNLSPKYGSAATQHALALDLTRRFDAGMPVSSLIDALIAAVTRMSEQT